MPVSPATSPEPKYPQTLLMNETALRSLSTTVRYTVSPCSARPGLAIEACGRCQISFRRSAAYSLEIEPGHRNVGSVRVGDVGIAIGEGEFLGFDQQMQVFGGIMTKAPQVVTFDDVQHFQRGDPLGLGADSNTS